MNFQSATLKRALLILGAFVAFAGIACGVAIYNDTVKPRWLKSYEKALALESINRKEAIATLQQALKEADREDAPLSSKKQIEQKLGDYLYANFAQSDFAKQIQADTVQGVPRN